MGDTTLYRCEQQIGYSFKDRFWLKKALTHSSIKAEGRPSNERLEFLGDAVLGMVISDHLFRSFRDRGEGELTRMKSIVVSRATLAKRSAALGLQNFISLGKGMLHSDELPPSVMGNVIEAIIGAVFIDGGIEPARELVLDVLSADIREVATNRNHVNFKSLLQQLAQREFASTPTYKVVRHLGPDHDKSFEVVAVISGRQFESAWGRSKKEAEQGAAELTYASLIQSGPHGSTEQVEL